MKIKKLLRPMYYLLRYILHCIKVTVIVIGVFALLYIVLMSVSR